MRHRLPSWRGKPEVQAPESGLGFSASDYPVMNLLAQLWQEFHMGCYTQKGRMHVWECEVSVRTRER